MYYKIIYSLLLIGLITCLVSCSSGSKQKEDVLIVGSNPNYPPYESYNDSGDIVGFDIEIAKGIADKLGKKLIIKDISFDALIIALKQGKIDMIISGMSITESRQKEIALIPYWGEEVKELTLAFWNNIPNNISELGDLSTVAVQAGTYQESFLLKQKGIKAKTLDGNADLIMDIKYGKTAAALFEPHIALAMQKKFPEIKLMAIPLNKNDWVLGNGIGICKGNKKLINAVANAVRELKKEGKIALVEKRWLEGKEDES